MTRQIQTEANVMMTNWPITDHTNQGYALWFVMAADHSLPKEIGT